MGGVLGKRPRVAAAPDTDDAGGVPDRADAAGLDQKGLSGVAVEVEARGLADVAGPEDKELTGRTVDGVLDHTEDAGRVPDHTDEAGLDEKGLVEVKPVDARVQGNGDCPRTAADLTDPTTQDPSSNQDVATLATSSAKDRLTTSSSTSDTLQNTPCKIKRIKGHGPLWKETYEHCNELLKEIESLSTSARLVKVPTFKLNKVEIIASYTADRLKLAQLKKEFEGQENHGNNPTTSLSRFCIRRNPKLPITTDIEGYQFVTSLDVKGQGFNLVIWQGSFALPTCCTTGNVQINQMNSILFDILMIIDDVLEKRQLDAAIAKHFWETRRMVQDEADRKAAVSQLRSTYRYIRSTILSLGGIPVNEPLEYWRETYPLVKF